MEYFKDNYGVLYQGDVLDELKKLPDESVNMCVTSPPYWNLRQYDTAKWVGGDINCDHVEQYKNPLKCAHSGSISNKRPDLENKQISSMDGYKQYKDICKKCGAKRVDNQLGLEDTPEEYINKLVEVFREVWRVLKKDGTLWLNIGDSYWGSGCGPKGNIDCPNDQRVNNSKGRKYPKSSKYKSGDLVGIPWMLSFALRNDGWYLRQDIIWAKKACMPESVKNRCTKSHEYIFLLSKNKKYYYDQDAIKEPLAESSKVRLKQDIKNQKGSIRVPGATNGFMKAVGRDKRNKRDVWWVATKPLKLAHYSTFPSALIEPTILAGCPEGGIVLDPFIGSGTTAIVAESLNRRWVGIELSEKYCEIVKNRVNKNKDIFTEFNISKEQIYGRD